MKKILGLRKTWEYENARIDSKKLDVEAWRIYRCLRTYCDGNCEKCLYKHRGIIR